MKELWSSMAINDRAWCIGNFIIAGASLTAIVLICSQVLPIGPEVLLLEIVFPTGLYFGMKSLWEAEVVARIKTEGRMCRGCGQRKLSMALEYGDNEGLCRKCLDEYLPLVLRR